MNELQVTCVTKRENTHYGITHLGGNNWYRTRQEVINAIRSGTSFYVSNGWGRVYVKVVRGYRGDYVQTFANNTPTDNLLNLPPCR
ncbi:MAG TPA: DUF3892 domain-containing protein [Tepidisphaeraceae bacterium]|jgi:hypothetical protein